ncbi:hypothetical protein [Actinomadura rupiterrae]|uniref:hypothetical protein n=1 Tax=Actinomadura rupiterrae TaxID=559627 RepID=UPI0020A57048|nr:hypothetical protein [Actinomadura rupiterrae]MCP2342945.1 hypothetical protein [Actinomadura rupiterrae]
MAQLVDPLALASLISPDSAGVTLDTHHGLLGVLPYRPGRSPNQRAWDGRIDWAALILYPRTASPVRFPVTEERLARDAANATAYLFPARLFTIRAWHLGGTFQHINHRPPSHPGVFWINLEDAPARGLLAPHQVAFST